MTGFTVGRIARLLGVSVRTLHHWDEIGLVTPGGRTSAGYRLYTGEDVARLHRVLVYRELGFGLTEIRDLCDDPGADRLHLLREQRDLLTERISQLHEMVSAVDRMVEMYEKGDEMTTSDLARIFGEDFNPEYHAEAERRWGDTKEWAQSQKRIKNMTPEQWQEVKAENDALNAGLAAAKQAGVDPASAEAAALAERHRDSISFHYDCTHSMQVCLGRMYVDDPRFTEFYENLAPGLARWLSAAIDANARAHGVDPDTATWE